VTLTATDTGGSGVDKTYYSLDGTTPTLVYSGPITISNDGIYTMKYYSQDKAGNAEIIKTAPQQVKIDKTAPTGSILINGGAVATKTTPVTLTLSAQDNTSGMGSGAQMQFSSDGITWLTREAYATTRTWTLSGTGAKTIYVKFKDVSGRWSDVYSATIILDTTLPSTTISSIDGLWHISPVTVTLTATDTNGSGVDKTYYSLDGTTPTLVYSGPITISNDGIYTMKYYSQDKAGNKEAIKTALQQVKIDKTAPTGSILINNGAASTTSPRVALKLSAVDSRSGMGSGAQMCFSIDGSNWSIPVAYATSKTWTFSSVKETKTIYVKFKDVAGNWSIVYSDTIILR
jgi:hypothetical protein